MATTSVHGEPSLGDALSLTQGGPLFRLQRRLHLEPRSGQTVGARFPLVAIAVAWLPIIALDTISRLQTGHWDTLLLRSEVHVRLIGALFLFLLGEGMLEARVRSVTQKLFEGEVLARERFPELRAEILRLVRVRDAKAPELLMLSAVYAATFAAFFGVLPPWVLRWAAPTIHEAGVYWEHATPAWWWYLLFSQPLFLFVMLRWLFRWGLWGALMWRLSMMEPRVDTGHADRAGGLGFLAHPLFAMRLFVAGFALSLTSVWLDEIAHNQAKPAVFTNDFGVIVLVTAFVGILPYLTMTRVLLEARHRGVLAYSMLMRRYTERFEARWLGHSEHDPEILGNNDFQALADLGTSFAVVKEMRVWIPGPDEIKAHLAASIGPFLIIPLLYSKSTAELIGKLVLRLIGG